MHKTSSNILKRFSSDATVFEKFKAEWAGLVRTFGKEFVHVETDRALLNPAAFEAHFLNYLQALHHIFNSYVKLGEHLKGMAYYFSRPFPDSDRHSDFKKFIQFPPLTLPIFAKIWDQMPLQNFALTALLSPENEGSNTLLLETIEGRLNPNHRSTFYAYICRLLAMASPGQVDAFSSRLLGKLTVSATTLVSTEDFDDNTRKDLIRIAKTDSRYVSQIGYCTSAFEDTIGQNNEASHGAVQAALTELRRPFVEESRTEYTARYDAQLAILGENIPAFVKASDIGKTETVGQACSQFLFATLPGNDEQSYHAFWVFLAFRYEPDQYADFVIDQVTPILMRQGRQALAGRLLGIVARYWIVDQASFRRARMDQDFAQEPRPLALNKVLATLGLAGMTSYLELILKSEAPTLPIYVGLRFPSDLFSEMGFLECCEYLGQSLSLLSHQELVKLVKKAKGEFSPLKNYLFACYLAFHPDRNEKNAVVQQIASTTDAWPRPDTDPQSFWNQQADFAYLIHVGELTPRIKKAVEESPELIETIQHLEKERHFLKYSRFFSDFLSGNDSGPAASNTQAPPTPSASVKKLTDLDNLLYHIFYDEIPTSDGSRLSLRKILKALPSDEDRSQEEEWLVVNILQKLAWAVGGESSMLRCSEMALEQLKNRFLNDVVTEPSAALRMRSGLSMLRSKAEPETAFFKAATTRLLDGNPFPENIRYSLSDLALTAPGSILARVLDSQTPEIKSKTWGRVLSQFSSAEILSRWPHFHERMQQELIPKSLNIKPFIRRLITDPNADNIAWVEHLFDPYIVQKVSRLAIVHREIDAFEIANILDESDRDLEISFAAHDGFSALLRMIESWAENHPDAPQFEAIQQFLLMGYVRTEDVQRLADFSYPVQLDYRLLHALHVLALRPPQNPQAVHDFMCRDNVTLDSEDQSYDLESLIQDIQAGTKKPVDSLREKYKCIDLRPLSPSRQVHIETTS